MNRRAVIAAVLGVAAIASSGAPAHAQPAPVSPLPPVRPPGLVGGPMPIRPGHPLPERAPVPAAEDAPQLPRSLRDRFGATRAAILMRSSDADERLRGLARAAAVGTPEAVSMLVHAARDATGAARLDGRALLTVARALAAFTNVSDVQKVMKDIVAGLSGPQKPAASATELDPDGVDRGARVAMARSTAALALAQSPDPHAVDAVTVLAREAGPGQAAAAAALVAFPHEKLATAVTGPMSPALLKLAGAMGDLRAVPGVRGALRSADPPTRAAALDALRELGDSSAAEAARAMLADLDPAVREAAVRALVSLGTRDRFRAVEQLIGDDATAAEGVRLAELAGDGGVVRALAARALVSADTRLRAAAVAALGRSESPEAVTALVALLADPLLSGDAAAALARSPAAGAPGAIAALLKNPPTRRLGARAYAARALRTGRTEAWGQDALRDLARSKDGTDRAVGVSALVLLGERDATGALEDPDPAVRRAVATVASLGPAATMRALLRAAAHETDPVARRVEMAGLQDADPEGLVPTSELSERALAGQADAPLASMALAARADPTRRPAVDALLASGDPIVRAHAARGLARSSDPDASGRLADLASYEVEPLVRLAAVVALGGRSMDADAPVRASFLRTAAHLDPDAAVREAAERASSGLPAAPLPPASPELAWVRLVDPGSAGPAPPRCATLLRSDGVAVPVAVDADGYALVPTTQGPARLLLEARLPAYDMPER